MIVAEKPPLNEDLLIHFGVKGMKWGQRKQKPEGEANSGMSTAKKVAIGASLAAGVAATAYVINRYGGSSVPTTSLASPTKLPGIPDHSFNVKVDKGRLEHRRIMNLLDYKKRDLDNAASLARIDKLLKQPTPKMPSLDRLVSADRRSRRVAAVKGIFNRPAKPPLRLFPAQPMFGGKKTPTDMGDLNNRLMNFNSEALRRGGAK